MRRRLGILALTALGVWLAVKAFRQANEPRLYVPSRKKVQRQARIAAAKAREQAPARPAVVHVQAEADTDLKVPISELKH